MKQKIRQHAWGKPHFDWRAPADPKVSYPYALNFLHADGLIRLVPGTHPMSYNGDVGSPARILLRGTQDGGNTTYGVGVGCGVTEDGLGVMVVLGSSVQGVVATVYEAKREGVNQDFYIDALGQTDLTGTGVYDAVGTLDTTTVFDSIALNDKIIFTNGIGTPFMYDCTTAAFTKLADAPIAKRVTTYYQKVVFGAITEAGKTNRIEWSEEGQPDVGYDAGIYDNLWVFGQQDTGPVISVEGTNDALYVFKRSSISAVRGPTEDAFTTDGTREGISTNIGALGPYCTYIGDDSVIYFLSEDRDLYALLPGGSQVVPITKREDGSSGVQEWKNQMPAGYGGWDNGNNDRIQLVYFASTGLLAVLPTGSISTGTYHGLLYNTHSGSWCLHDGFGSYAGRAARMLGAFEAEYQISGAFNTVVLDSAFGDYGIPRWLDPDLIGSNELDTFDTYSGVVAWLYTAIVGSDSGMARKLFTGLALRAKLVDNSNACKISMYPFPNSSAFDPTIYSEQNLTIGGAGEEGEEWVRFGFREYGVNCTMRLRLAAASGSSPHDVEGFYVEYLVGVHTVDAMTEFSF